MPVEPVVIDTTITAVGEVFPSYGNVLIIGENEGGSLAVNTVGEYTNLTDVGTDFGTTSKVYQAAEMIFNQGVSKIWAIKVDVTSVVGESITAGSVQSFANGPVKGGTVAIATYTIEYDYNDPPTDPGANKAEVGTEGTKIFINGTGAKSVDYDYYDLTSLEAVIKDYEDSIDLLYFCAFTDGSGNGGAGPQDWGVLANMVDFCNTYTWVTVIPGRGDEVAATQVTDLTTNTETSYESRNVMLVAHLDTSADDDVGAAVIGRMSLVVPWDKMMWKPIKGLDDANITEFSKSEVTTFETNKINALFERSNEWRPSDGLTSLGGTEYKHIDITRTRYWLEKNIKADLGDLIQDTIIPFTNPGIAKVKGTIQHTCEDAVVQGALRVPWTDDAGDFHRGYVVEVPDISDVAAADKTDRILKNVFVTVYLSGHIQEIRLNLAIIL